MNDMTERLALLSLFSDLTKPQLEHVSHMFEEEMFPAGQRILRQGFTGANLYVILDGEACIVLDGKELARLGRGEFFGEVSALLGEPPTADVQAATPLRCLVIPQPEVKSFLVSNPQVMYRILQAEARRLSYTLQWRG